MKKFYTLEGTEGSGKSTAIKILETILKDKGLKVFITREPGGTSLKTSEKIRNLILSDDMHEISAMTEFLLYLSSRKEHIDKLISKKIEEGYIVISDRYNDSSVAYQGYAKDQDRGAMEKLSEIVMGEYIPNKTFFIDVKPEIGLERIAKYRTEETNRFDFLSIEFHNKVYAGYKDLEKNNPNRFVNIDGEMKPEQIANEIARIIIKEENGK